MTNSTTPDVTLYGAPMSMYSGKVRAYLRKHCIAFQEVMPGDLRFREKIYPQVKRGIVPILEHADGQLVQDTVDIIDHFENHNFQANSKMDCNVFLCCKRNSVMYLLIIWRSTPLLKSLSFA